MKYIKSVDFSHKGDVKKLFIEITDKKCFLFEDIYMLIEHYRKKVDVLVIWFVDSRGLELALDPNKTSTYDIQTLLEKLV